MVLETTQILQHLNATSWRNVPPAAPTEFVPARRQPYLSQATADSDHTAFRHYWELALLYALRNSLRSGEIWVEGSRRYADPATYLLTDEEWHKVRTEALSDSGCAPTFAEQLKPIEADTARLLNDLEGMLRDSNSPVRLDGEGRLRLQRLTAERVDAGAMQTGQELAAQLPSVPLSELLIEIDQATGFTNHLTHAGGAQPRHSTLEHQRNLYAAIFAQHATSESAAWPSCAASAPTPSPGPPAGIYEKTPSGRLTQPSSTPTTTIPSRMYGEAAPSHPPTVFVSRSAVDPSPPAPTPATSSTKAAPPTPTYPTNTPHMALR